MARLSSSSRLGNTSTSGLLRSSSALQRSASTLQAEINTYNDTQQKIQFENNPSDGNLQTYLDYLSGRVSTLSSSGSITDATKAMTISQSMNTAVSTNTSFMVQNMSIQVMAGNATPQDKLQALGDLYQRAQSVGDMKLAQGLESQAYSLQQTIQQQQQVASDAQITLNTANNTAIKAGYTSAIDQIKSEASGAMSLITSGQASPDQALKQVSSTLDSTLKALTGTGLPKDASPNIGSVLSGMFAAEYAYNLHASDSLRASDPTAADSFATYDANGNLTGGHAYDIMANQAYIKVAGLGNVNSTDAYAMAHDPNSVNTTTNSTGGIDYHLNPIVGYSYTSDGILIPTRAGTGQQPTQALEQTTGKGKNPNVLPTAGQDSGQSTKQLENLGFTVTKVNADGSIDAKFTSKTDHWTQSGGKNPDLAASSPGHGTDYTIHLVPQSNGTFQFKQGNTLRGISIDTKGLGGIYNVHATGGASIVAGQYGFNQSANTMVANATITQMQAKAAAAAQAAQAAAQKPTPQAAFNGTTSNPAALQGGQGPSAFTVPTPSPGGLPPANNGYTMTQRAGGGFNFAQNGKAVSAAAYAQGTGTQFRSVLQQMANAGDSGARSALGFVGNDYGYNPSSIGGNGSLYNSLTWGTGHSFTGATGPQTSGGQLTLPSGMKL